MAVAVAIFAAFYPPPKNAIVAAGSAAKGGGRPADAGAGSARLAVFAPPPAAAECADWPDTEFAARLAAAATAPVDKHRLRQCLSWVLQSRPAADPSRYTLRKLSRFFMAAGFT